MEFVHFYLQRAILEAAIMPKQKILHKIFIWAHRTANDESKHMFSGSRNVYKTLEFCFDT